MAQVAELQAQLEALRSSQGLEASLRERVDELELELQKAKRRSETYREEKQNLLQAEAAVRRERQEEAKRLQEAQDAEEAAAAARRRNLETRLAAAEAAGSAEVEALRHAVGRERAAAEEARRVLEEARAAFRREASQRQADYSASLRELEAQGENAVSQAVGRLVAKHSEEQAGLEAALEQKISEANETSTAEAKQAAARAEEELRAAQARAAQALAEQRAEMQQQIAALEGTSRAKETERVKAEAAAAALREELAEAKELSKASTGDSAKVRELEGKLQASEQELKAAEAAAERERKEREALHESFTTLSRLISKETERGDERHREVMAGQRKLALKMEKALSLLHAHTRMLHTVMRGGIDKLAPKYICFVLPEMKQRGWRGRPQDWLMKTVLVYFVDPVTMSVAQTNGGKGFEIDFPKRWVARAMPYVKLGLTVLKVAAVAGKLSGIPIPDVKAVAGEWVDAQLDMLATLEGDAVQQLQAMMPSPDKAREQAEELLKKVDARCEAMAASLEGEPLGDELKAPLEKSLKELDELLKKKYPNWKEECGLVLTLSDPNTGGDGTTEWVLPEHVDTFKAKGAALFDEGASARDATDLEEVQIEMVSPDGHSVVELMRRLARAEEHNAALQTKNAELQKQLVEGGNTDTDQRVLALEADKRVLEADKRALEAEKRALEGKSGGGCCVVA